MVRKDEPYTSGANEILKGLRKSYGFGGKRGIRYRCTCPVCGAKLVNLYFINHDWMCNKCKEKEDA